MGEAGARMVEAPAPEPELVAAARAVLAPASAVAAALGAQLLSLAAAAGEDGASVSAWTGAATVDLDRKWAARAGCLEELARLEEAGAKVAALLARRWPAEALPPKIALLTDGTGLALCPDHPSGFSAEWLAKHRAGALPLTFILPFAGGRSWSSFIAPEAQRLH
jgi:hypothetical protein